MIKDWQNMVHTIYKTSGILQYNILLLYWKYQRLFTSNTQCVSRSVEKVSGRVEQECPWWLYVGRKCIYGCSSCECTKLVMIDICYNVTNCVYSIQFMSVVIVFQSNEFKRWKKLRIHTDLFQFWFESQSNTAQENKTNINAIWYLSYSNVDSDIIIFLYVTYVLVN